MAAQQGLPIPTQPVQDASGQVTQAWRQFFLTLWQRTGGSSGAIPATVIDSTTTVTLTGPNGVAAYRDDAQAAAGGVAVGQFYHNGSVFQLRIS